MAASKRGDSGLAGLINAVGFVLAAVLVVNALLVLLNVSTDVEVVQLIGNLSEWLTLWWPGLIPTDNETLQVLVDHGVAALFWVVVAAILARAFG
ncbi:hypothetical protein [Actinoalloteichus hymeniacidonis]|uniref:Uncharacterized protein n=1 Tax=Actinoalloteichus hymeniacidonis TaxID=340345 RepID=A0AAC9MWH6_9PSEU|nr:hypothetical protein [Actinoalloteichus hymeniacidonis]AOS61066.1 hypothetical protein TL08_01120 [Actinoalloteichus hymeniacidonis]MBB5910934.1 hypothetical protein [Actinoalloteichus hymeniacidonis]